MQAKSTYISQIIEQVNGVTASCGPVLLFGENIDTGSRIAGLARGLTVNSAGRILNVGNSELTHCGIGFGTMLDGGQAVLFMKQLDFLLLGLDQLINTFNCIRAFRGTDARGSFTIFLIVCDQGYQGPQSSLNSAGDFASIANVPVYCLNGAADASLVVGQWFVRPGFRVICVSQRQFGLPPLPHKALAASKDGSLFQYASGEDATIVCFNFALRQGISVAERLRLEGLGADLFHANFVPGLDPQLVAESFARTGKLVVIDDSKTLNKFGDLIVRKMRGLAASAPVLFISRSGCSDKEYGVVDDEFRFDSDGILSFVREP